METLYINQRLKKLNTESEKSKSTVKKRRKKSLDSEEVENEALEKVQTERKVTKIPF